MSQENVEIVKANIDAYNREDWDAFFSKTRLRASSWTSRGQSVLGAASSDLIRLGESWRKYARPGNPLGWSPTNSSKPVIL